MSEYKEFQGKTLDAAIQAACSFFDEPREKLEIDIISDAKAGIFGLVGARKATIRARRVAFESVIDSLPRSGVKQGKTAKAPSSRRQADPKPAPARPVAEDSPRPKAQAASSRSTRPALSEKRKSDALAAREMPPAENSPSTESQEPEGLPTSEEKPRSKGRSRSVGSMQRATRGRAKAAGSADGQERNERPAREARNKGPERNSDDDDAGVEDLPRRPLTELNEQEIITVTRETLQRLVAPLLGEAEYSVRVAENTIHVSVDGGDDPGLLIGRDGQTLASVQYLATRIISNKLQCLARVHVDAGDYRQRQDERLRELALSLAGKVRESGRTQMTRPLSSYQRRISHLTLQDDDVVQTHSKGDGEMKRVIIAPRRQASGQPGRRAEQAAAGAGEER